MSALTDRIRADLSTAMKARDELTTSTLRMTISALRAEEVSGSERRELTAADELTVLSREAKRRREAATAFADAGRNELAERERAEGEVLAAYLPEPLDEAALTELVRRRIAELGVSGAAAMGQVMGAVKADVQGRADGGQVAAIVRRELSTG